MGSGQEAAMDDLFETLRTTIAALLLGVILMLALLGGQFALAVLSS